MNLDVLDNFIVDFNRTDQQRDADRVARQVAVGAFAAAKNAYAVFRDGSWYDHAVKQHLIRSDVTFVRLAVFPSVRVRIGDSHRREAIDMRLATL